MHSQPVLFHQKAVDRVDILIESITLLKRFKLIGVLPHVQTVNSARIETFGFG